MNSINESIVEGSVKILEKDGQDTFFPLEDDTKTVSVFDYISQEVFADGISGQMNESFYQELKTNRTRSTSNFEESIKIECK